MKFLELDIQSMLFELLGGLGIFLLGIKIMGEGLQQTAGERLREILGKFTTNPLMGVLAGIIITLLLQSSSAAIVLTIGLVSAGFLTLRQAIGVIMGANIGTTFTAFIIGLDIGDYALPILALGAFCIVFFKKRRWRNIGSIIFGFGALFYGLELMGNGMKPLSHLDGFHELTLNLSETPILGVIMGTVLTVIVQSSSATVGIVQGLYSEGLIHLNIAVPILFGDNIGTTITTILATVGATIAAKRAALIHILFNVIGAAVFIILLNPFLLFLDIIQENLALKPEFTIAMAHGTFNITNTILQLPFIGLLIWLATKLLPGEDTMIAQRARHLDTVFIQQSPAIALGQAKEEVLRMGKLAIEGLGEAHIFLKNGAPKHGENAYQIESVINHLDRQITDYLIQLSSSSLSKQESAEHTALMDTIRDIERIGDHFENLVELMDYKKANKVLITDSAMNDLDEMFKLTITTVIEAIEALDHNDKAVAEEVIKKEEQIDKMERQLRRQHIIRLSEGVCSAQAGIVYVDILSNLERIGDHAVNIAEAVIGEA